MVTVESEGCIAVSFQAAFILKVKGNLTLVFDLLGILEDYVINPNGTFHGASSHSKIIWCIFLTPRQSILRQDTFWHIQV